MSRLDDVKNAFLALTAGLTEDEKMWAIKQAFPNEVYRLSEAKIAEAFKMREAKHIKDFKNNDSNVTLDNTKEKFNIKYDDNIVEIGTAYSINVDIESEVECGYVGGGGMHFTYDNPEETTIRLMF